MDTLPWHVCVCVCMWFRWLVDFKRYGETIFEVGRGGFDFPPSVEGFFETFSRVKMEPSSPEGRNQFSRRVSLHGESGSIEKRCLVVHPLSLIKLFLFFKFKNLVFIKKQWNHCKSLRCTQYLTWNCVLTCRSVTRIVHNSTWPQMYHTRVLG
jgi:hypothetical protein